jgi:pimeloyl-ACP methyl ester carboxylesterase
MKTKMIISALFLLSTIFAAQGNNYIWLHGLNDDSNCWSIYQNAFTPSNGSTLGYASNASIADIASNLWFSNRSSFVNGTILIGHSMGGLVARELEYNYPSPIKGIITIGTPHQGAPALNELYNGGANNLTKKVVGKAKNSVKASLTAIAFTIPGVGYALPVSVNLGVDLLYKYVGIPILDKAINEQIARDYSAQCSKDMVPGSTYMNNIGIRQVEVPILTFACEEDRWQLPRVGYCTQKKSILQADATANANGDFDLGGYNQLKSLNNTFKVVGGVHAGIAVGCGVGGFFFPYLWAASAAHANASSSWYSTAGYIDDGLDFDHAVLLGAYHVDRIDKQHRFLWKKWTTTTYVATPEPHDGVVSVKSQQLDKYKGKNVIWANTTIKGVNHMEEFNHPNTRKEFDAVLNGKSYSPLTFQK